MKYKAVIFDLDGVICSTDELHYKAWKKLADQIDVPFDRNVNARLRGVSRMRSLEIILEKSAVSYTSEQKVALAERKNGYYVELLGGMSENDLDAEVKSTLEQLRSRGLLLAIGSSSKNTPTILNKLGLGSFFDAVSDGNSVKNSKPEPDIFLHAAELLKLSPAECLVVEDAPSGVEAGKRGGFDTAAVGYASETGCANYNLTSFKQLLEL